MVALETLACSTRRRLEGDPEYLKELEKQN